MGKCPLVYLVLNRTHHRLPMPSGFRVCGRHLVGLKVGRGIDVGVVSAIAHRTSRLRLRSADAGGPAMVHGTADRRNQTAVSSICQ